MNIEASRKNVFPYSKLHLGKLIMVIHSIISLQFLTSLLNILRSLKLWLLPFRPTWERDVVTLWCKGTRHSPSYWSVTVWSCSLIGWAGEAVCCAGDGLRSRCKRDHSSCEPGLWAEHWDMETSEWRPLSWPSAVNCSHHPGPAASTDMRTHSEHSQHDHSTREHKVSEADSEPSHGRRFSFFAKLNQQRLSHKFEPFSWFQVRSWRIPRNQSRWRCSRRDTPCSEISTWDSSRCWLDNSNSSMSLSNRHNRSWLCIKNNQQFINSDNLDSSNL